MSEVHTPGPWAWMGGPHGLYLATTHSGRRYVMGFRRMGFNNAQPVFCQNDRMVPAADLVEFEVGDQSVRGFSNAKANDSVYRYDVSGIDNANARLIAAAPDLLEALKVIVADCSQIWSADEFPALKAARSALSKASDTREVGK